MSRKKGLNKTIFIIFLIVTTGFLSYRLGTHVAYSSDNVFEQLARFQEVFKMVNTFYVEPPDKENLVTGAITGMLEELDPHSVYIPKEKLERVTEQFEGSFEGIGIEFVVLDKVLTVVSPIVGGPSEAVGILPGDQIIKIEGESAYGITEDEVQDKLRGPKGSKVEVTIRRPGVDEPFDVVITRDTIPIYSVMASFMLDDGETGYIYLGRFARTTAEEVEKALDELEAQGMKRLIFDLRQNSGGYLDQAFKVADKFIPGGYKIVYTKGRTPRADSEYYSESKGTHPLYPMVVMIDHGSASASEIVSGAVQDLDRGLIVGQTSFGKGLVQNQIPLRDGGALRLTIARYYTPSGRLIQRPYENGNIVDYYEGAYEESEQREIDSTQVFETLAGRKVYGGGGITPDTLLTSDRITAFTNRLRMKRIFFEFGSDYAGNHRDINMNFETFKSGFEITPAMMDDLEQLVEKHELEMDKEALEEDRQYIELLMKAEIARHLWDNEHYYQIRLTGDSEVQTALDLMPRATEIVNLHDWD